MTPRAPARAAPLRTATRNARKLVDRRQDLAAEGALWARQLVGRRPLPDPEHEVVVSMTSHGSRLQRAHLAIESIAQGSVRPARILLWVNDRSIAAHPPRALRRLQRRGLEINVTENVGPHCKYHPYVRSEAEHRIPLVTADDDVLYPRWWLAELLRARAAAPEEIRCFRARVVTLDEDGFSPYAEWPFCDHMRPDVRNFATGVSGVVYPPRFLDAVRDAGTGFLDRSPGNDDVWLHYVAVKNGFTVRQVRPQALTFPTLTRTQTHALLHENVGGTLNDIQIAATYDADVAVTLRAACR